MLLLYNIDDDSECGRYHTITPNHYHQYTPKGLRRIAASRSVSIMKKEVTIMAVIRVHKTKDYTIMSNSHLREKKMSLKAKGLLSVMLSLPSDWNYTVAGLVSVCSEQESAIISALNELKKFGYLRVVKLLPNETDDGRIRYIYNIYETPQLADKEQDGNEQGIEKQGVEKQGVENQGLEFQGLEFQGVENQGQLNTNIPNTNIPNTKQSNTNNKTIDDCFEKLWALYPRKTNKGQVSNATKRKLFDIGYDKIARCIERYKQELKANHTPLQYTKAGSTFFNSGYIDYLGDDWVLIENDKQAAGEQKQKNNNEDDDYISRAYRMMREYED